MAGRLGLDAVAARVLEHNTDTRPVSGRQEGIENLLNSFI
jgi:xylose isomerase